MRRWDDGTHSGTLSLVSTGASAPSSDGFGSNSSMSSIAWEDRIATSRRLNSLEWSSVTKSETAMFHAESPADAANRCVALVVVISWRTNTSASWTKPRISGVSCWRAVFQVTIVSGSAWSVCVVSMARAMSMIGVKGKL